MSEQTKQLYQHGRVPQRAVQAEARYRDKSQVPSEPVVRVDVRSGKGRTHVFLRDA